jgi:hypothetical protein
VAAAQAGETAQPSDTSALQDAANKVAEAVPSTDEAPAVDPSTPSGEGSNE